MKKTLTITQIGFVISGSATIYMWGGGKGVIEMEKYYLPYDKCTPKNILRCVNDNGFGCETIESAEIDISIKFNNGNVLYDRSITADHKIHTQYFLGWKELAKQGIEV